MTAPAGTPSLAPRPSTHPRPLQASRSAARLPCTSSSRAIAAQWARPAALRGAGPGAPRPPRPPNSGGTAAATHPSAPLPPPRSQGPAVSGQLPHKNFRPGRRSLPARAPPAPCPWKACCTRLPACRTAGTVHAGARSSGGNRFLFAMLEVEGRDAEAVLPRLFWGWRQPWSPKAGTVCDSPDVGPSPRAYALSSPRSAVPTHAVPVAPLGAV